MATFNKNYMLHSRYLTDQRYPIDFSLSTLPLSWHSSEYHHGECGSTKVCNFI